MDAIVLYRIYIHTCIITSGCYEASLRRLFFACAPPLPFFAACFAGADFAVGSLAADRSFDALLEGASFLGDFVDIGCDFFEPCFGATSSSSASASRSSFRFFAGGPFADFLSVALGFASTSESAGESAAAASFLASLASFLALYLAFKTFCFSRLALMAACLAFCGQAQTCVNDWQDVCASI